MKNNGELRSAGRAKVLTRPPKLKGEAPANCKEEGKLKFNPLIIAVRRVKNHTSRRGRQYLEGKNLGRFSLREKGKKIKGGGGGTKETYAQTNRDLRQKKGET